MAKLTKKEQEWLEEFQAVLDRCPSNRLAFYTTGDPTVTVYDYRMNEKICSEVDSRSMYNDFGPAAHHLGAILGVLRFPNNVASTAG